MPTNQYLVVMETVPSAQLDASALEHFFVPAPNGKQVPLTDVAWFEQTTGPLSVAHSGQMASMTISFNLAPGVSLGAATDEVARIGPSDAAGDDHRPVRGHGAGVPGFAAGHGAAAPDHDLHHLHHSRDSLRELHPSDHDPDRSAVRGVRRAVRALARARRAGRVRLRRHHHADRHRGEERDHDDRLRARASAHRADPAGARRSSRRRAFDSVRS